MTRGAGENGGADGDSGALRAARGDGRPDGGFGTADGVPPDAGREVLRSLVRQIPAPVALLVGPEHRFELVNEAYQRMSGGRRFTGLTPAEAFPELADSGMYAQLDRVYATGEPWSAPETLVRYDRDGTGVIDTWFNVRIEPVRDGAGRVSAILNFAVDVTEQVRARREVERLLAESERARADAEAARGTAEAARARADAVLSGIADPFYLLDREWRFTYVNDAAEPLLQTTRDRLLGRIVWDAFPEAAGSPFDGAYREAMATNRATSVEAYFPPLRTWFDVRTYPWAGGLMVHFRDVGARKAGEAERERLVAALEAERARLAGIVRMAPAFMAVLRGPDHVIELTNVGYDALVGKSGVRGRRVADALPEAAAQGFVELLDRVIATGEPVVGREVPYRRPDATGVDEERYVDFVYQALHEADGTRSGVFVHGVDVTEQVRARAQVEQLLAAERAARAAAEAAANRSNLLQDLTAALSRALTREQMAAVVVERVAGALGAHLGVLALITPEGDRLAVAAVDQPQETTWSAWETFPLDAPVPLAAAVRERRTVVYPTFAAIAEGAPSIADLCRAYGTAALCAVPVIGPDGRVLGALGLSFPGPRALEDEVGLLETLAGQAAQALERARLFEAERTARAHAEAFEARLRDVFEQAPVAVAVLTGPDHVYSIVSPLYGETPGAGRPLLGRSVRDAFPELDGTGYVDTMDRVYATGEPFSAAERRVMLRGRDGALREYYFNIGYQALRDRTGSIYAVASVAYDVTDQVRARHDVESARAEAERQRAAADAANRAKGEFLSTMSHELRTPLNAIGGYAELLALGLRGPLNDAQRQDLERLRRANHHMTGLVEAVLNFTRLSAGQVEYHIEAVPLGPLVSDLDALVGPQFAAKALDYVYDTCAADAPDGPHVVRADAEKVRQVLLNLLTNAAKFTDAGGRVSLTCEPDRARGLVRLRVSDTGRGIPPDQIERVFEPFVQVDRQRTHTSQQGVGLGLAISRDLARGMGGDLTAESAVGRGSTFTLTLPHA